MAKVPSIRIGNYGNGVVGLKTSIAPFDVTVLADDNDSNRRSFNSEWTNVAKPKIIGVASQFWGSYTSQYGTTLSNGVELIYYSHSDCGWQKVNTPSVATGLSYIPVWEARYYDAGSKVFYDDNPVVGNAGSAAEHTQAGLTGYFVASNAIVFDPSQQSGWSSPLVAGASNQATGGYPPYPAFPAFPPQPPTMYTAYVIYANKLGDWA